jgi:hypothetical protein
MQSNAFAEAMRAPSPARRAIAEGGVPLGGMATTSDHGARHNSNGLPDAQCYVLSLAVLPVADGAERKPP